jgi:hypothetical protein
MMVGKMIEIPDYANHGLRTLTGMLLKKETFWE